MLWSQAFVSKSINEDCDPFMRCNSEISRWTALLPETAKKAKEGGKAVKQMVSIQKEAQAFDGWFCEEVFPDENGRSLPFSLPVSCALFASVHATFLTGATLQHWCKFNNHCTGIALFYDPMNQKDIFEKAQVLSSGSLQLTLGTSRRM